MSGHGWYRGDVVSLPLGPETARGIVREVVRDRAKVQIGHDWTWVFTGELIWNGESLVRLPRTEWGWRRLGQAVRSAS